MTADEFIRTSDPGFEAWARDVMAPDRGTLGQKIYGGEAIYKSRQAYHDADIVVYNSCYDECWSLWMVPGTFDT
jgi:hypothetical protein